MPQTAPVENPQLIELRPFASLGGPPGWDTRPFPRADRTGRLVVLASGDASDREALPIRADARVLGARLMSGETISYALAPGRHAYLVPAKGALTANGMRVHE